MSILNFLQKRPSGDGARVGDPAMGDAARAGGHDGQLPIPGYDRIGNKHVVAELSKHSQAELAAIETYERSHKNRLPVFDKLRYLRGKEPLAGYDALTVEQILAELEGADQATLQRTRLYERKFKRRPDLLEEIATALRDRRPASTHRDPPPARA
jgi:hypothetical protein